MLEVAIPAAAEIDAGNEDHTPHEADLLMEVAPMGERVTADTSRLTGPDFEAVIDAIVEACVDAKTLSKTLEFRLSKQLNALVSLEQDIHTVVFDLCKRARAENWLVDLVAAVRSSNPGNTRLLSVAGQIGLSAATPDLERRLREDLPFLDTDRFCEGLAAIENRVCRIEIPRGVGVGTGFLVGPRTVMTCYHVVHHVIDGSVDPGVVKLRFDYRLSRHKINPGVEFSLDLTDWLVAGSPRNAADGHGGPHAMADAACLDYAVLRIVGEPGEGPVGMRAEPGAARRGWVDCLSGNVVFETDAPLLIVQHPNSEPLKLAMDTRSVIGLSEDGLRVRYRTNTEPGSSGSPVFDYGWRLLALHQAGHQVGGFNQGVPIDLILNDLRERGLSGEIGAKSSG